MLHVYITLYSENHKEGKNQELKDVSSKLDQAMYDIRKFYDFERFDINYLADAVLFTKADAMNSGNANQVVISAPGQRQKM